MRKKKAGLKRSSLGDKPFCKLKDVIVVKLVDFSLRILDDLDTTLSEEA